MKLLSVVLILLFLSACTNTTDPKFGTGSVNQTPASSNVSYHTGPENYQDYQDRYHNRYRSRYYR